MKPRHKWAAYRKESLGPKFASLLLCYVVLVQLERHDVYLFIPASFPAFSKWKYIGSFGLVLVWWVCWKMNGGIRLHWVHHVGCCLMSGLLLALLLLWTQLLLAPWTILLQTSSFPDFRWLKHVLNFIVFLKGVTSTLSSYPAGSSWVFEPAGDALPKLHFWKNARASISGRDRMISEHTFLEIHCSQDTHRWTEWI